MNIDRKAFEKPLQETHSYEEALLDFQQHTGVWFKDPKILKDFLMEATTGSDEEHLGEKLAEFAVGTILHTENYVGRAAAGSSMSNEIFGDAAIRAGFPLVLNAERDSHTASFQDKRVVLAARFEAFCYAIFIDQGLPAVIDFVRTFVVDPHFKKNSAPDDVPPPHRGPTWRESQSPKPPSPERLSLREAIEGATGRPLPDGWAARSRTATAREPLPLGRHSIFYPHVNGEPAPQNTFASALEVPMRFLDPQDWPSNVSVKRDQFELDGEATAHGVTLMFCDYWPNHRSRCRGILADGVLVSYRLTGEGTKKVWQQCVEEARERLRAVDWDAQKLTPAPWPPPEAAVTTPPLE